jgi:hypothetical protein
MADLRCCDFRWYSRDAEQFPLWLDYTTDRVGRHRKKHGKFLKFAMSRCARPEQPARRRGSSGQALLADTMSMMLTRFGSMP